MAIYDENVICPITGDPIQRDGSQLVSSSGRRYQIDDGLPLLFVDEQLDDSSIPRIHGEFTLEEQLFSRQPPGSRLDRKMTEIEMLFTHYGGEGGLYIMIGQRSR